MGVYNPHAPRILGQEWVPIKDEDLTFSPVSNAFEIGHTFTPTASRTLQDGRFYVHDFPPGGWADRVMTVSVYPTGYEAASGPVKRVVIPINNGAITGNFSLVNASTVAEALASPADGKYMFGNVGNGVKTDVSCFFSVNQYAQYLMSKRIVGLNLLYISSATLGGATVLENGNIELSNDAVTDALGFGLVAQTDPNQVSAALSVAHLGEVNVFDLLSSPQTTGQRKPWTYPELQRLEATAGVTRRMVRFSWSGSTDPGGVYGLFYAALEVLYCEEQRVAIAMSAFGGGTSNQDLIIGTNPMNLLTPAGVINPVLSSGTEYTVTLSAADVGDVDVGGGNLLNTLTYPALNADLELYQINPHRGKLVSLTTTEGETFSVESTHVMSQVTLCTSGAPLRGMHVYGRQAAAPVYGSITAQQNVLDSAAGGAANWPWVRFYARRWGNTTIPLVLDSPTITGSSTSISVSDFDALDEILDGWKQVSLRFTVPPSMGASTSPTWRWSATGENVGNRWEILGATAPAVSGITGNLLNLAPSPTGPLGTATYGAPSAGSSIEMTWLSPAVTAVAADSTSDAVLIFAQDLPAVTGLAVVGTTQSITGIGQDCGAVPCCVPNGLTYNRLTWSATSSAIPASGFGYYELQRSDDLTDWQTIMVHSSVTGASFSDYESRVGILTSYRIRAVDVYGFYNDWSATVTITMSTPGITGGSCLDDGHILIFTSNEHQDGAINLAYSSIWDSTAIVDESFTLPEAGLNVLQPMYGKDFFTAFRPTERGGVIFTRTLLVQAAAISPETLADFTSLRDMAWDQVSYICVRDEDGNRWFANVVVPSSQVQLNRSLYMAPVTITQVTDTASQVDPAA